MVCFEVYSRLHPILPSSNIKPMFLLADEPFTEMKECLSNLQNLTYNCFLYVAILLHYEALTYHSTRNARQKPQVYPYCLVYCAHYPLLIEKDFFIHTRTYIA